jgi:thiamine biosynthesis protein ThiS
MIITVNGKATDLAASTTLADLVRSTVEGHRHVAVAHNGAVARRGTWADVTLADGDTVEILVPVAGG